MGVVTDSDRFQAWLQDTYEARQRDSETISIGPFLAVITRADDGREAGWVTLVDAGTGETEALQALNHLGRAFGRHRIDVEVEYDAEAFPEAGRWFEDAGLSLVETNPLMACRPDGFQPTAAPHIALTRLGEHARAPELEAFQTIRWSSGGDLPAGVQPIERLRSDLRRQTSVYLLAWLDWEAVGTGVSHVTRDAAEIVGVVTRNDRRRRGVAAAVTGELVRRHFERGGDWVFLDAANEEAARVYERLGFRRFGSKVVYR